MRDFRFYELDDREFERLVTQLCVDVLGTGTVKEASWMDGGLRKTPLEPFEQLRRSNHLSYTKIGGNGTSGMALKTCLSTLIANFQRLADILRAADANPAQNRSWRLQFTPDNRVIQTAEEGVAKVFGQRREARHRVHRRGQALDFNPAQAGLLHVKGR